MDALFLEVNALCACLAIAVVRKHMDFFFFFPKANGSLLQEAGRLISHSSLARLEESQVNVPARAPDTWLIACPALTFSVEVQHKLATNNSATPEYKVSNSML